MTFSNILALFGGLALFLYGMHMMSIGLENSAGNRMKTILEKLTSNHFLGVLVGALITAVIQSSSATTVMVVGFVNSRLMTLNQAVWIIMGANIGTTITGQLIALDASRIAPLIALFGVILVTFIKSNKLNAIGDIFAGLGILFIGMDMMKEAMIPLQDSPMFLEAITTISNPFLAVVIGALFTALIQSSSASVGILQALALGGLIPLSSSIYIIFGQNIGTCITAVLASLGANRMAKRTTIIHLSFNIIGTIIYMIAIQFIPFVNWMVAFTSNPAQQIANTHTIFNITTSILLIPFGNHLAKLAQIIMPIHPEESEEVDYNVPLMFIDKHNIGSVTIAISSLRKEAQAMLELAQKNIMDSIQALINNDVDIKKIEKREKRIDFINFQITDYMSQVSLLNKNEQESNSINALYKCFSDIERIGDHAYNIMQYAVDEHEYHLTKTDIVKEELQQLLDLLQKSFTLLHTYRTTPQNDSYEKIERIENRIDELTASYRQKQIDRLYEKQVDAKDCVIYSEIMTDIERISDHIMNIIEECKRNNLTLTED